MCLVNREQSLMEELENDFEKATKQRDYRAMREIYIELERCRNRGEEVRGREETVFFSEVTVNNAIDIPEELSLYFGKRCYIALYEDGIDIDFFSERNLAFEEDLRLNSIEMKITVFSGLLSLSPLARKVLELRKHDIVQLDWQKELNGLTIRKL